MFKKFLSYFIPITIYKKASAINKSYELTWNNGVLHLDTQNTNYSYGSLQRVLRLGLKMVGYTKIINFNKVLILGVAGGSVIKTLRDEVKYRNRIIGVELDPEVITIANEYYDLSSVDNLDIVIEDAFEYVLKCNESFDLIVIDVFQDTVMPSFLFENYFIKHLKQILNSSGSIIFNTMVLNDQQKNRNSEYKDNYISDHYKVRSKVIDLYNELIIIEKSYFCL